MEVRVRYAPSPTGYLHIGGARTAIFNYLFAKHNNGKFIVRIEDTDLARNITDGIDSQLDNLRWMNVEIDETVDHPGEYGPYKQTERLKIYLEYAQSLIENEFAYRCFCDYDVIAKMKEEQEKKKVLSFKYDGRCSKLSYEEINKKLIDGTPYSIRLKIPENKEYKIDDMVRGEVKFYSKDLGDFIIVKTNGIATYNFAVVIDDQLMKISHVLRGEEHLSNTPRQLVIYDYFNWQPPKFGHLTLIINDKGKKLSKRDGSLMQFIHQYRNQGFLPEALFNFITLLGWSSHEEKEIYSVQEFIKIFNSDYLSKAPSMFDVQKLLWMNNYYIKNLSEEKYFDLVIPFVKSKYDWNQNSESWWKELVLIYQRQLMYGAEIINLISMFFKEEFLIDGECQAFLDSNETNKIVISSFYKKIKELKSWDQESISEIIRLVKQETAVNGKLLYMPIRIAATSQMHGPELPQTIKLLGQKKVLENIEAVLNK